MKNIFLTGFMGCGKTTIGKLIKSKTKFKVIDTDLQIKKCINMPIEEIFNKYGEQNFRNLETILLKKINKHKNLIVVTGGATLISNKNFEIIKNNSIIIFINTNFEICLKRIQNSKRPLIKIINSSTKLKKLYIERQKQYEQIATHSILELNNSSATIKFNTIMNLIKKLNKNLQLK